MNFKPWYYYTGNSNSGVVAEVSYILFFFILFFFILFYSFLLYYILFYYILRSKKIGTEIVECSSYTHYLPHSFCLILTPSFLLPLLFLPPLYFPLHFFSILCLILIPFLLSPSLSLFEHFSVRLFTTFVTLLIDEIPIISSFPRLLS